MKAEKPIEAFREIRNSVTSDKDAVDIDSLSEEEKAWLRNAG